MIKVKTKGAKALDKALKRLADKESRKVVRDAVKATAKADMKPAIQSNALFMVGGSMGAKIAAAQAVRSARSRTAAKYTVQAHDESLIHTTQGGQRYYIPAAIEFGHADPGKGGSGSKDVPAIPYARQAYETTKNVSRANIERGIWKRLIRAIRKQRGSG
jgi:dienelactone hydrolase